MRQQCVFGGPERTKSKLTYPSDSVSFTLARGRQMARPFSQLYWLSNFSFFIYTRQRAGPVLLSHIGLKLQIFLTPLSFSAFAVGDPF